MSERVTDDQLWRSQREWELGRRIVRGRDDLNLSFYQMSEHLGLRITQISTLYYFYKRKPVSPLEIEANVQA